jgi:hypothetical protein
MQSHNLDCSQHILVFLQSVVQGPSISINKCESIAVRNTQLFSTPDVAQCCIGNQSVLDVPGPADVLVEGGMIEQGPET